MQLQTQHTLHRCGSLYEQRAHRFAAATALLLHSLLFTPAAIAQQPVTPAASSSTKPFNPQWGHELAQLAPDPAVRFGRLDNGMRYAIQHHQTPKEGVAMRMHVRAGSLHERDDEKGLAHFLEHMAFRGSAGVPDGDVVRMLQRQGLSFGADTNAFTAPDQTVYHFNFPKGDTLALDTGLALFREIGSKLTLDPALIEQEKGVVLSEERTRDVPPLRSLIAEQKLILAGTRVVERFPIGQVETITAATAQRLRRYYHANYRPDNTTLVVVGNIDVDAVERHIRERFSDWQAAGQADALDLGQAKPVQMAVEFVAEGAPDKLSLNWLLPVDIQPATLQAERSRWLQQMAAGALNLRLADRSLQPGSPFLGASASVAPSVLDVTGLAQLSVAAPPEQWQAAIDSVTMELRRLLAQGVQPSDLQRLMPMINSSLQASVAQAPTRHHAAIADALVQASQTDAPYLSAQQRLEMLSPMLQTITPDEVSTVLRRDFGGSSPLVFRSTKAAAVGPQALAQQVTQAMGRPLVQASAVASGDWTYTNFGAASAVQTRSTDAELASTIVEFANGTRLVVKSTAQEKDKVNVLVSLGHGRSGLTSEQARALWALELFPLGGTAAQPIAEVMQWKQRQGKLFTVKLGIEPNRFVLVGDTRPADLSAQMQVLTAFARAPGFRPEMADKLNSVAPMMANQFESLPALVYMREAERIMNNGEVRMNTIPTLADLAATRADQLPEILRAPLASAADVAIVGDVTVDEAIAAVQATFGSGPARPRTEAKGLRLQSPTDGGTTNTVWHRGRTDQAVLGWMWSVPDYWAEPNLSAIAQVAAAVLRGRLQDTVRAKLGMTYSPNVMGGGSRDVAGQGGFMAMIETPPVQFDAFRNLLREQLAELTAVAINTDELQRAKSPLVERVLKAPETNGHWIYWLPRIVREPRMKASMLNEADELKSVTADQVQAFFRDRIGSRKPIEVESKARP